MGRQWHLVGAGNRFVEITAMKPLFVPSGSWILPAKPRIFDRCVKCRLSESNTGAVVIAVQRDPSGQRQPARRTGLLFKHHRDCSIFRAFGVFNGDTNDIIMRRRNQFAKFGKVPAWIQQSRERAILDRPALNLLHFIVDHGQALAVGDHKKRNAFLILKANHYW